jgi:DNA (cytosine-5)-methyltransferase 1
MNHVDLFSGIGGFAYAAKQIWENEYHNVCFCDNNKYTQQDIKLRFGKESLIYDDIRELTREKLIADTDKRRPQKQGTEQQANGDRQLLEIDLLTGGFPCQPFSCAGQQRGTTDDRFLWPEMLRIIKELKPRWIIGENVTGILGMAQQQGESEMDGETDNDGDGDDIAETNGIIWGIINDIEQAGYDVQTFVIPACAVNAPHRRSRVWIVAYSNSNRSHGRGNDSNLQQRELGKNESNDGNEIRGEVESGDSVIGNSKYNGLNVSQNTESNNQRSNNNSQRQNEDEQSARSDLPRNNVTNTLLGRQSGQRQPQQSGNSTKNGKGEINRIKYDRELPATNSQYSEIGGLEKLETKKEFCKLRSCSDWTQNWLEVATSLCGVDDGLPAELDGLKLSKSGHRVERLKALGNAIVPKVVMEIMKAIKIIDELPMK